MHNLSRQLIDIQHQAEKIVNGNPSVTVIEDFSRYSEELRDFVRKHVDVAQALELLEEIPVIEPFTLRARDGWVAFLIPSAVWLIYQERSYVATAVEKVRTCRGKFASLEFLVRNSYDD